MSTDQTQAGGSTDNNPEPNKELPGNLQGRIRALLRLARQRAKATHHLEGLTTNLEKDTPPVGLVPRIRPQIPSPSITFTIEWQDRLQETGIHLTKLLIDFWKERLDTANKEAEPLETELKRRASEEEWNRIETLIDEAYRGVQMELKRKKPRQRQGQDIRRAPSKIIRRAEDSNEVTSS